MPESRIRWSPAAGLRRDWGLTTSTYRITPCGSREAQRPRRRVCGEPTAHRATDIMDRKPGPSNAPNPPAAPETLVFVLCLPDRTHILGPRIDRPEGHGLLNWALLHRVRKRPGTPDAV